MKIAFKPILSAPEMGKRRQREIWCWHEWKRMRNPRLSFDHARRQRLSDRREEEEGKKMNAPHLYTNVHSPPSQRLALALFRLFFDPSFRILSTTTSTRDTTDVYAVMYGDVWHSGPDFLCQLRRERERKESIPTQSMRRRSKKYKEMIERERERETMTTTTKNNWVEM